MPDDTTEEVVEERICVDCEGDASESTRATRDGGPLCDTCQTCADCGGDLPQHRSGNTNGEAICEECGERYVWSEAEDCVVHEESAVYLADTEEYVSDGYARRNCYYSEADGCWYFEAPEAENALFDYNTNVLDHVKYDRQAIHDGALVLGVELEMEPREEGGPGRLIEALGGKLSATHILKYDSSVPNGVELVTAPMTLAEHRGGRMNWADTLEKVRGIGRSGGGTTRCGMHVHVNKAAVSPLTVGKLLVFLNSDGTDSLVTTIAQRSGNNYCEKKDKRVADGRYESESRYERLNVTGRTLEFRIFRGNLRVERIMKNIEFCVAAVAYCAEAGIREVEKPEGFLTWIGGRKRDYPALTAFLRENGTIAHTPTKKEKKPCA